MVGVVDQPLADLPEDLGLALGVELSLVEDAHGLEDFVIGPVCVIGHCLEAFVVEIASQEGEGGGSGDHLLHLRLSPGWYDLLEVDLKEFAVDFEWFLLHWFFGLGIEDFELGLALDALVDHAVLLALVERVREEGCWWLLASGFHS